MSPEPKYWFPAKRYGWGWGLPSSWQGWVALVVFVALVMAGGWLFPPHHHVIAYVSYMGVLVLLFTSLCWLKGEPPRWR